MRTLIKGAALAASLMLAGCGENRGAGELTPEENRQLDNAAEMLDTSPDSMVADDEAALGNGEESVEAGEEAAGNEAGNGQQ